MVSISIIHKSYNPNSVIKIYNGDVMKHTVHNERRRLNARALSNATYLRISNCLTQFLDIIEAIYII